MRALLSRGNRSLFVRLSGALVFVVLSGCALNQQSQFRGSIARGDEQAAPATHQLGGQFGRALDGVPEALFGVSLGQAGGSVVFVYDKATAARDRARLSNRAITAVYYTENMPWDGDAWADFLRHDARGREQIPGVRRLEGALDVQRWKSNIDFHIRLDMRSAEPEPLRMRGVVTTHDRWEFRPFETLVWTGYSLGLVGPASATRSAGPATAPVVDDHARR